MITKLYYYSSNGLNPYRNQAIEEYLLQTVGENGCILYLWQNQNTVVIGKNQNPWKECRGEPLEAEGGHVARRLSGGGAVYHDLGNLNFTYLVNTRDYDLSKQLEVILRSVRALGIPAEKSGRNDITAYGKKFSGNAFYESGGKSYHHGTILVDSEGKAISRYLRVSNEKLKSKGVDSVQSRVGNLREFLPDITVELVKKELLKQFSEVYGLPAEPLPEQSLDFKRLELLEKKYASWEWRWGRPIPFEYETHRRFSWGEVSLQLQISGGRIQDAVVFSDAMDWKLIQELPDGLNGCIFNEEEIEKRLSSFDERYQREGEHLWNTNMS